MKRIFTSLLLLLLFFTNVEAQTLRNCFTLDEKTDRTTTSTGSVIEAPFGRIKSFSIVATADADSGTNPTLDIKIQSCRTSSSSSCRDFYTFDQCTTGSCWTTGDRRVDVNRDTINWFKYFRSVSTIGGTLPVYDLVVEICYESAP